ADDDVRRDALRLLLRSQRRLGLARLTVGLRPRVARPMERELRSLPAALQRRRASLRLGRAAHGPRRVPRWCALQRWTCRRRPREWWPRRRRPPLSLSALLLEQVRVDAHAAHRELVHDARDDARRDVTVACAAVGSEEDVARDDALRIRTRE